MAIGTNDPIHKFGTQTEVTVASPASVANGAYSASTDTNIWTNSDDAPLIGAVLKLDPSAAPTKNDVIELHGQRLNIVNTTEDEPQPDSNYESRRIGYLHVDVDAAAHIAAGVFPINNIKSGQEWRFYIKNTMTTVSIDATTWELWITPMTVGPHA